MKNHYTLSIVLLFILSVNFSYSMENTEFNRTKENITNALQADVISTGVLKDIIRNVDKVEQKGTRAQQAAISSILQQNEPVITQSINATIKSTLVNKDVKKCLAAVAMGTVYGVLPSVGFKALSILSGNLDLATASTELIDIGILSAIDSFVRYAEERGKTSPEMASFQASAISTGIHQFIGYAGKRPTDLPFLGKLGRPLLTGLQSLTLGLVTTELKKSGGVNALLQKINWKEVAQGPTNQSAITKHSQAYDFIKNNLTMIVQNQTVRGAIATTVTYAVEGAIVGAVMHSLGLGFYDESLPMALTNSMMRGALEGLYHFSQYGEKHLGVAQRLKGGFVSTTVQRYIQTGAGMGALDITPVAVQQITSGAVTSIVRQAGGWANTFKSLYSTGKKAIFG